MKLKIISALIFSAILSADALAATRVELYQKTQNEFKNIFLPSVMSKNAISYSEMRRDVDLKNMLHVRVQQTYKEIPIWGADVVLHIKQGLNFRKSNLQALFLNADSIDGVMYQNLQNDLGTTPTSIQLEQALRLAINDYQKKVHNHSEVKNPQSKLVVYVDENNKAHWSYLIHFDASAAQKNETPAIPTYIIDANTLLIFEYWNDMKTSQSEEVKTGGFGGNPKMGQLVYDGLQQHFSYFASQRDTQDEMCYLSNPEILVQTCKASGPFFGCYEKADYQFPCHAKDPAHNNIYWNDTDAVNGGYSPSNDAFFNADVTKKMYQDWMHVPVLTNSDGSPMRLVMVVHLQNYENAYWKNSAMYFGDGQNTFYPLTSLGVTAHEVSHGFTEQHSNLQYSRQSGGMNEAYSDMAAKAAEFYAYGKDLNWDLGSEIFKEENKALRYLAQPSKDCEGKEAGDNCSIDDASQYNNSLDVHYSSGAYNHFFYLLSTSQGWDTKKAFILMAHANAFYWTSTINFRVGACGVLKAAKELNYDTDAINKAFEAVKIDLSRC